MKSENKYKTLLLGAVVTPVLVLCAAGAAQAFQIDLGNPDIETRLDTTVRYNLGFRVQDCDKDICGNNAGRGDVSAYQSDRKFSKAGDVVTNRVDLLSEMDVIYKQVSGFRVSAAGWYDAAYDNKIEGDTALDASGAGQGAGPTGGGYSGYTRRWSAGPSGEILDAFAFTKVQLGDVPVSMKLGQHNIYWGESLFSFVGGVAYQQGPVDIRKAQANPGSEAKELFKPLNQFSFGSQLLPELTVAGQYLLDWDPSPLPEGGTYFGAADGLSLGGKGTIFGAPTRITGEPDKRGDWGLSARWRPEWLNGAMGFYYREYNSKFPQLTLTDVAVVGGNVVPAGFGLDYSSNKREKMFGWSLAKQVWDISWGADVTYRKDAMLSATPFATFVPAGTDADSWIPRGTVLTGLVNAVALFSDSPLWDTATLIGELNYSHLDKVTENAQTYNGKGYNCRNSAKATSIACQTRDQYGIALSFQPTWYQVFDGVDLSMPLFYSVGLKGNSPVMFGDNEGQGVWSVGVAADMYAAYNVSLKYNGFIAKHSDDELGAGSTSNASLGKYWDRDWVSLTFKASF